MKIPMLLLAVVIGLVAAYLGYNYLNQPQPMSDRIDNATSELGKGNLGEAADEATDRTKGDKLNDDLKDAAKPVTAN